MSLSTDAPCTHQRIDASRHRVPPPFRALAVRCEAASHAGLARAPLAWVHRARPGFLDAPALAVLSAIGQARVRLDEPGDITHAQTSLTELAAAVPTVGDAQAWASRLAAALCASGVLGDAPAPYAASLRQRIDFLACWGAGFHNDVARHWPRCLFWVLVLQAADVEFVMPHAGLRLALAPGELVVFDQTMAHGLARPADQGLFVAASFGQGADARQMFLTGELLLSDAQWAALGSPWLPVAAHAERGALDLMLAEFDDRSGAVQCLAAMRDCLSRPLPALDAAHPL